MEGKNTELIKFFTKIERITELFKKEDKQGRMNAIELLTLQHVMTDDEDRKEFFQKVIKDLLDFDKKNPC